MHNLKTVIGLATLAVAASFASAHFDVSPYVSGGRIVTGGHDDATGEDLAVVRAFGYDFGEDPADPYFVQDPGFNAEPGSGLPAGSQLSFNVLGGLRYWNGTGDQPAFGAAPAGEAIQFSFGAQSRTITSGSAAQGGFALQTVGADGSAHRHLNAYLLGSDGNAVAGDGIEATPGIYAVLLELASSSPSVVSSDAFYVVYNHGLTEAQHDAATDALAASIVPEPTTLATFGMLGLAMTARRRSR